VCLRTDGKGMVLVKYSPDRCFAAFGSSLHAFVTSSDRRTIMTVARVTEITASSRKSFDDAIKLGLARAVKTLQNVKGAWIQNQEVVTDAAGAINEYRVHMKVTFVLND
jgi:flavin-binding protein dodecin